VSTSSRSLTRVAALTLTVTGLAGVATAQDVATFFRQNCTACHTIGGGRLTGPDLKNVTAKKDRAWLVHFIQNPKAVIDAGDPYAVQLQQEARGVIMPTLPGMNPALADALIALVEAESKLAQSQFVGVQISDRPFTPADLARGTAIFEGTVRLAGGGPACLSCHSTGGVGAMGGGKLAPDLTLVYERLGGRKGVGTWLSAPATPTMQATFANVPLQADEILPLLALFENAARTRAVAGPVAPLTFFLMGLAGAAFGLVVFDLAWQQRFRSVRRRLVERVTLKGTR
jgi:mono/diheme cytochrome c family protein